MGAINKQDALARLLDEVKNPTKLYGMPAYAALIRLATFTGKIPFSSAMASLSPREVIIIQSVFGYDEIVLVQPEEGKIDECNILIAFSALGKLSIYERAVEMPSEPTEIIAGVRLEDWLLDKVEDECLIEDLMEKRERQQLDEMLLQWEAEGLIDDKIDQAIDWVERTDNIFIYIDKELFSKTDIGTNTLIRGKLLQKLKEQPPATWTAAQRLCVVTIHLCSSTGRFSCIEEFNGMHLTASRLRHWLMQKLSLYLSVLGESSLGELSGTSLARIAAQVGVLTGRMTKSSWAQFRRINGITLNKKEYLFHLEDSIPYPKTLPKLLVDLGTQELGVTLDTTMNLGQIIKLLTAAALQKAKQIFSTDYLERIIETIILSSVLETSADYGMSSCIRNPSLLKGSGVFSLSKEDFFCCVLPHPQALETIPIEVLDQMLYSSALRMEYNRWHFIPGNFPRSQIPLKRHYFFPPKMSDIAEWSDQRHPGHIAAQVRHTVRAPGPPLWKDPLIAFGHCFYGFYDIRLVRIEGPRFEKEHMWVANYHSDLLGIFWNVVLKFIEEDNFVFPIINAYTRDWYMKRIWQKTLNGLYFSPI